MNFLKGFKQKLSNVGDDIKSFSIRTSKKAEPKQIKIDDCSFLGGAQLLEKYQNDWSSVHAGNEMITKTAWRIDQSIGVLHKFVTDRHDQYSRVAELMATDLPRLETDLDNICSALANINESIERTELALAGLEDQIEWCELRQNELTATNTWLNARRQSATLMDAARVCRAKEHAARVAKAEQLLQTTQRERAATFEEEFQRDVQHFREHGKIERAGSYSNATDEELAAIQVSDEKDVEALDEFLNEPVVMPENTEQNEVEDRAESSDNDAVEVEGESTDQSTKTTVNVKDRSESSDNDAVEVVRESTDRSTETPVNVTEAKESPEEVDDKKGEDIESIEIQQNEVGKTENKQTDQTDPEPMDIFEQT